MKVLLTLMVLASVSNTYAQIGWTLAQCRNTAAQPSHTGDAEMKALLIGTWAVDDDTTYTFTSDGRWLIADPKFPNNRVNPSTDGISKTAS
jgi:hypothetical protein